PHVLYVVDRPVLRLSELDQRKGIIKLPAGRWEIQWWEHRSPWREVVCRWQWKGSGGGKCVDPADQLILASEQSIVVRYPAPKVHVFLAGKSKLRNCHDAAHNEACCRLADSHERLDCNQAPGLGD